MVYSVFDKMKYKRVLQCIKNNERCLQNGKVDNVYIQAESLLQDGGAGSLVL